MTVQADLVAWCVAQEGKPYGWGATGPGAFDCSGLMQKAYLIVASIDIGRDTAAQQAHGQVVAPGHERPSDLAFFGDLAGAHAHVGMYIGGGKMVDAPHTGAVVRVDDVTGWAESGEPLRGFRRYIDQPLEADLPLTADDLSKITTIVQEQIANECRPPNGGIFILLAEFWNNQFNLELQKIERKLGI